MKEEKKVVCDFEMAGEIVLLVMGLVFGYITTMLVIATEMPLPARIIIASLSAVIAGAMVAKSFSPISIPITSSASFLNMFASGFTIVMGFLLSFSIYVFDIRENISQWRLFIYCFSHQFCHF